MTKPEIIPYGGSQNTILKQELLEVRLRDLALFIFVYFSSLVLILGAPPGFWSAIMGKQGEIIFSKGYEAIYVEAGTMAILFMFYKKMRVFVLNSIDISIFRSLSTYLFIVLGFLFPYMLKFIFINFLEIETTELNPFNSWRDTTEQGLEKVLWLIALIVVRPITEEVIFRGILYRILTNRLHWIVGLLVSSVIFGLLHTGYPISGTLMGCFFCLAYQKTNSLVAPIAIHMIWNAYVNLWG